MFITYSKISRVGRFLKKKKDLQQPVFGVCRNLMDYYLVCHLSVMFSCKFQLCRVGFIECVQFSGWMANCRQCKLQAPKMRAPQMVKSLLSFLSGVCSRVRSLVHVLFHLLLIWVCCAGCFAQGYLLGHTLYLLA